jgi:hypothetical protein
VVWRRGDGVARATFGRRAVKMVGSGGGGRHQ